MIAHHFIMLARYNRWANARLYDAASRMNDDERARDVGAFFGSMIGTLNHILVADRIWMRRFTGEGPTYDRLDEVPYPELDTLRVERDGEDEHLLSWVGSLDDATLSGTFTYMPVTSCETVTQRLAPALTHVFNHQTHHRGQAHTILTQLGYRAPALDLIYFQREATRAA